MRTNTMMLIVSGWLGLLPVCATAVNPTISGFLDATYMLSDGETDGVSNRENKFETSAELDFESALSDKAWVRVDGDFVSSPTASLHVMEQGYLKWKSQGPVTLVAGLFNNPVGWEAGDAPDMYQVSHGQLSTFLDNQTQLYGNNVMGLAVTADVGDIELTGGILNDLGNAPEENSLMGVVRFVGSENLNVELGLQTQDAQAETLIDLNGTFKQGPLTVGGEILLAGEQVDMGLGLTASYKASDLVTGTVRFDNVGYDANNLSDTSSITIAGSFKLGHNVVANAEVRMNSNSDAAINNSLIGDGTLVMLELLAIF